MARKINIGDEIPSFSVLDHEGLEIESDDLIGSPFVLYFYPKDDTPGCTKQACSFRDSIGMFDQLDTLVIGVSPDNASSHTKFIEKNNLDFMLLCDENLDLASKFGVLQEKEVDGKKKQSVVRSTFIADAAGAIRWIESPANIEGHTERVLKALEQIVEQTVI